MRDDLTPFLATPPDATHTEPFDVERETGLHCVRWPRGAFRRPEGFVRFCCRYSCVMAQFSRDPRRDDLADRFVPDPHADAAAAELFATSAVRPGDARDWTATHTGRRVPWLEEGDHTRLLTPPLAPVASEDDWPDLSAWGDAGYLHLFEADL